MKKVNKSNVKWGKKKPVNKNQGCEPIQQKYKANKKTNRHNSEKKQKQTINKNNQAQKTLCIEELTHGYEMTINNNKENLKQKSYHLPQVR